MKINYSRFGGFDLVPEDERDEVFIIESIFKMVHKEDYEVFDKFIYLEVKSSNTTEDLSISEFMEGECRFMVDIQRMIFTPFGER